MNGEPPQSPEYNYDIVDRMHTYIIILYEGDFIVGSFKLDSQEKLDEWQKKLETIEVTKRLE